ncbi:hypothetical protein LAZ67_X004170 [Cordylochernes scorpioides]|uniref:Uncharacterized protein n=1 Tax=Cordylochernes scorpioides TaxID=51811 RepID=A0ABY6LYU2_9ARAC|nr:hypothetical protein LAZ67_X004170 [Cordylochernes scorpioides]
MSFITLYDIWRCSSIYNLNTYKLKRTQNADGMSILEYELVSGTNYAHNLRYQYTLKFIIMRCWAPSPVLEGHDVRGLAGPVVGGDGAEFNTRQFWGWTDFLELFGISNSFHIVFWNAYVFSARLFICYRIKRWCCFGHWRPIQDNIFYFKKCPQTILGLWFHTSYL